MGTWKGKIVTYKGELPFELQVTESRQVLARVGNQMQMLVKIGGGDAAHGARSASACPMAR